MIGLIFIENETGVEDVLSGEPPDCGLPGVGLVDEASSATTFRGRVSSESFTQLTNTRGNKIIAMRLMNWA
jgi:hypothetical protein